MNSGIEQQMQQLVQDTQALLDGASLPTRRSALKA